VENHPLDSHALRDVEAVHEGVADLFDLVLHVRGHKHLIAKVGWALVSHSSFEHVLPLVSHGVLVLPFSHDTHMRTPDRLNDCVVLGAARDPLLKEPVGAPCPPQKEFLKLFVVEEFDARSGVPVSVNCRVVGGDDFTASTSGTTLSKVLENEVSVHVPSQLSLQIVGIPLGVVVPSFGEVVLEDDGRRHAQIGHGLVASTSSFLLPQEEEKIRHDAISFK
jgi:hypothetical protein